MTEPKDRGATRTLRRQRGLGLFDNRLEGHRLAYGEVGQHLTINGDTGLGQPGNEPACS